MSDRSRSMQRIVRVQEQMKRLAEWKLGETEAKIRSAEAARRDLDGFVEQPESLGRLGTAALRQVQRLAERQALLAAERDRHAQAHVAAQRRLKGAETLAEAVARSDRDVEERRSLEVVIEAAAARARRADLAD